MIPAKIADQNPILIATINARENAYRPAIIANTIINRDINNIFSILVLDLLIKCKF